MTTPRGLFFRVHQVEAIYHETGRSLRWDALEIAGMADVQQIAHKVSARPLEYKPTETDGGLRLEFDDGNYRWLVYGTPIGRAWEPYLCGVIRWRPGFGWV